MTEYYISFRGRLRGGEWGPWRRLELDFPTREEAEAVIEDEKEHDVTAMIGWEYEYEIEEVEGGREVRSNESG